MSVATAEAINTRTSIDFGASIPGKDNALQDSQAPTRIAIAQNVLGCHNKVYIAEMAVICVASGEEESPRG